MAKKSEPIKVVAYVIDKSNNDSTPIKCFEIDRSGKATDYLPENERKIMRKKMMKNCGVMMSRYLAEHPNSGLLK